MTDADFTDWPDEPRPKRTVSAETRARMSAAHRGRPGTPRSPEARARIAAGVRARYADPAERAKTSAALRAVWDDPERRARHGALTAAAMRAPAAREAHLAALRDEDPLGECAYCGGPARQHDHVIPRGRPGWDDPENVVLACRRCNSSKGDRTPDEWLADGLYGSRASSPPAASLRSA